MAGIEELQRIVGMTGAKANIESLDGTAGEIIVAYATDSGEIGLCIGGAWVWVGSGSSSPGSGEYEYVLIRDEKAQNTAGGTFTAGDWRTRDLNTEAADTGNVASLASNQITLAAGTYRCRIVCPAFYVGGHQARLQNITAGVTVLVGTNTHCETQTDEGTATNSFIVGRFTLAAPAVLEVQHRCQFTRNTSGFGPLNNWTTEVYTVVELWKEP